MRRKPSLLVPLLLILLGTLLLVRNFLSEFPFWDLVARYWPLVLVVWGLAKLAGALRAPPPGAPAWRPSLTIGEFFLALLIVLIGVSASKWKDVRKDMLFLGIDWPWSRTYSFSQVMKQEVEPQSAVRVESFGGDVAIRGADTKEIAVTVNKTIRSISEEEARVLDARLQAEIVREGRAYVVRISHHPQLRADMEVTLPRATPLKLEVRRGSLHVSDVEVSSPVGVRRTSAAPAESPQARELEGELLAEVDRGDVSLSGISGNVKLQIRRGSLSAENIKGNLEVEGRGGDVRVADLTGHLVVRGDYSGAIEFARVAQGVRFSSSRTEMEIQKLPGRVEMTIGSLAILEPGGPVSVNTRNKDIRIEEFPEKVQIVNRGASVELRMTKFPLKDIEVENHSGSIDLAVPAKSEFQIEATAARGEAESEFAELEVESRTRKGSDSWIRGKVGGGGANIKLNTSYGMIRLRKLGPEAEPAEPRVPVKPRETREPREPREPREVRNTFDDWPSPPARAMFPRPPRSAKLPKLPPLPTKSILAIN